MLKSPLTFIDLFAGCGGLSEGFYKLGMKALAHVEIDKYCCATLRERMRYYGYSEDDVKAAVLQEDITDKRMVSKLENVVGNSTVDLIIGGPPCQAYSSAGRARDFNGMKKDPRNFLFEHYVRILNHFLPKVFVFENVIGILTANINGEKIINKILTKLADHYVLSTPDKMEFNTAEFGVPQLRRRIIIIGVRKDLKFNPDQVYEALVKTHSINPKGDQQKFVTVKDAIGELPSITAGAKAKEIPFISKRETPFTKWIGNSSLSILYDHVCRTQNEIDSERYCEMARNHWTFEQLLEQRPDLQHPKKRIFGNSYVVQFWNEPSRTIIAHLCKDGNQFIHPDAAQARSISVREAARLQSFPDDFRFAGSMTQQFKQIGNAVPPLFAYRIASAIADTLIFNRQ